MYPIYFYYSIMLELERQSEKRLQHNNLHQSAGLRQIGNKFGQKTARWFGTQLVTWGSKLQNINTASPQTLS